MAAKNGYAFIRGNSCWLLPECWARFELLFRNRDEYGTLPGDWSAVGKAGPEMNSEALVAVSKNPDVRYHDIYGFYYRSGHPHHTKPTATLPRCDEVLLRAHGG